MNRDETRSRTWPLSYWRDSTDRKLYLDFASRYYGYFFAVLSDQLRSAVAGTPGAPKLTIAVMSDSNISPLLFMYGLEEEAKRRPPYLSALVHEVYEDMSDHRLAVRVVFNGKVLRVCSGETSFPFCPLDEWAAFVEQFVPSRQVCPALYDGYEFLAGVPGEQAPFVLSASAAVPPPGKPPASAEAFFTSFATATVVACSALVGMIILFLSRSRTGNTEQVSLHEFELPQQRPRQQQQDADDTSRSTSEESDDQSAS